MYVTSMMLGVATPCSSAEPSAYGGDMIRRNVGELPSKYMALQARKSQVIFIIAVVRSSDIENSHFKLTLVSFVLIKVHCINYRKYIALHRSYLYGTL
jgi:hypothetical protein